MRLALLLCAFALVPTALANPAAADDPSAGATARPNGDPVVYVGTPGSSAPGSPSGGGGSVTCGLYEFNGTNGAGVTLGVGAPAAAPVEGQHYILVCRDAAGVVVLQRIITYTPGTNVVDAATLARQAYRDLPLAYPQPFTAPPVDAEQLVGVRTWFWIDPAQWQSRTATAVVPGLSATVTAEPVEVRWDTGDGATVVCRGPGVPYDATVPDAQQHSACSTVFQHDGVHDVRATIVWRVRWAASDGSTGALPDVTRATQFPLQAVQRQAVIGG